MFILAKPLAMVYITEGWGHKRERGLHAGVDLRAPVGTPCFAAGDATVHFAGQYADGSGGAVELDHADGMATRYLHLSKIGVAKGQKVKAGDKLGETGHAVSPHLHFDAWVLPAQVPLYAATFGMPVGGITEKRSIAGRIRFKVPVEPMVLADKYQDDVIKMMKEFKVPARRVFGPPAPPELLAQSVPAGPTFQKSPTNSAVVPQVRLSPGHSGLRVALMAFGGLAVAGLLMMGKNK